MGKERIKLVRRNDLEQMKERVKCDHLIKMQRLSSGNKKQVTKSSVRYRNGGVWPTGVLTVRLVYPLSSVGMLQFRHDLHTETAKVCRAAY